MIDLIDINKSDVKYEIINFPDGQKHIKILDDIKSVDFITGINVKCRIRNAEDLFILMQLSDILTNNRIHIHRLYIYYLLAARTDRRFSSKEPFTLKIVADIINKMQPLDVYIMDPHSNVACDLIRQWIVMRGIASKRCLLQITKEIRQKNKEPLYICLPDEGAFKRYAIQRELKWHDLFDGTIRGSKVRNPDTGKLSDFEVKDKDKFHGANILVLDDLCDGGGTFLGLAEKIKETFNPASLSLAVTHAVQFKGIEKVASVYDNVYITDSYKDWAEMEFNGIKENNPLPSNARQIPVVYYPYSWI